MTRTAFTSTLSPSERTALIADAKHRAQALRREALLQWRAPWLWWKGETARTATAHTPSRSARCACTVEV